MIGEMIIDVIRFTQAKYEPVASLGDPVCAGKKYSRLGEQGLCMGRLCSKSCFLGPWGRTATTGLHINPHA